MSPGIVWWLGLCLTLVVPFFFLGIFFVHSKIISLSAKACPWNTSYELELFHPGILSYANSRKSNKLLLSQEEREGGKKGRYQNHFLDIKTWRKRKKHNNCLFRKPCVSLTLTHKESPLSKTQTKGSGHLAYLLTQGI